LQDAENQNPIKLHQLGAVEALQHRLEVVEQELENEKRKPSER